MAWPTRGKGDRRRARSRQTSDATDIRKDVPSSTSRRPCR